MRGVVQFQWRKRKKGRTRVLHRAKRITQAGHHSADADPKGFSAARCRIATPATP